MSEQEIRTVFRKNLNFYMQAKHVTPKQICDVIGVTKTTVSEWRLGKKMPRMDKIEQLCHIFGCARSDLLEERKIPPEGGSSNMIDTIIRELAALPADRLPDVLRYICFVRNE